MHGSAIHPSTSFKNSELGLGLANGLTGLLYSNSYPGVIQVDPATGATIAGPAPGVGGTQLGIATDPQTGNLVFADAKGGLSEAPPNLSSTSKFSTAVSSIDGMAWDPTGNFLFLAASGSVAVLNRSGVLVQTIHLTKGSGPDGMAFHSGTPEFLVSNNNDGTITRYDFPSGDFTKAPTQSVFASGGSRGDHAQVGPDGCLYVSQQATHFGDGTITGSGSLVQICGGFVAPVPEPTFTTTSLSGGGQSGTSISVPQNTAVTDTATLSGTNSSTATGTVTYDVYSDSTCTTAVSTGTPENITTPDTLPASSPVSLPSSGIYYWRASYSGDTANLPSESKCGTGANGGEVEMVGTTPPPPPTSVTTSLSGGGQSGTTISVPPSTAVTDAATLTGTDAATATGTVTYTVYSDAACTTSVNTGKAETITTPGKLPPSSALSQGPGTYYWQASYSGDTTNAPSKSTCGAAANGGEVETVQKPSPTVTTSLSGGGQSGPSITVPTSTAVTDTATLSGASSSAGGMVTYTVYSDSACTTTAGSGGTVTVTSGKVPASNPVTLTTKGIYYWQATYTGDTANGSAASSCGPSGETETVAGPVATPTSITTYLSLPGGKPCTHGWGSGSDQCNGGGGGGYSGGSGGDGGYGGRNGGHQYKTNAKANTAHKACGDWGGWGGGNGRSNWGGWGSGGCGGGGHHAATPLTFASGTAVIDSATLSGTNASTATGTVTYDVYSDSTCTGSPTTSGGTVTVTAGSIPSSNPVSVTTPGTYYWQASYSGDGANAPSMSTCGSEVETVTPAPTRLTTMLLGGGSFDGGWCWWVGDAIKVFSGTSVTDSATLNGPGVASAGGTVTYTVYSDPWRQTVAADGGTFPVTNGSVPNSNPVTLTTPGTYFWQATYSGDTLNAPSSSSWGSETEIVTSVPNCKNGWDWGWDSGCKSGGNGNGNGGGNGNGHGNGGGNGGWGHWW